MVCMQQVLLQWQLKISKFSTVVLVTDFKLNIGKKKAKNKT